MHLRRHPAEPRRGGSEARTPATSPTRRRSSPIRASPPRCASAARSRSRRGRCPRRGDRADGAGGVHQPGRDPAHRAPDRDRARRGGGAVPLPRGHGASPAAPRPCRCAISRSGVLVGYAGFASRPLTRTSPAVRRPGRRLAAAPASFLGLRPEGRPARGVVLALDVDARTTGGHYRARRPRRRRPPRLPVDLADARRGRPAARRSRDPRPSGPAA